MKVLSLAWRSLLNRKFTVVLTLLSIAVSVALILGVEKVRRDARLSFSNTISGTDLIVGARSGAVQLLLYSVFRIGNATNNISWESYREIAAHKAVSWTIPMSLGDSHRGFRVLGTNLDYFEHYRYGRKRPLELAAGSLFADLYDAVLGAAVAAELGYEVGDGIVLAHGAGDVSLLEHRDKPFKVAGILRRTGTPLDRTVHVSLEAIEAIHANWGSGMSGGGRDAGGETAPARNLQPRAITAFLVGLKSKIAIFGLQRAVNGYSAEPLLAILPGVALQELWDLMGLAERALLGISIFVVISGLIGMMAVILSGLNERRREMAILRSVGARPMHVFSLLTLEAGLVTAAGVTLGLLILYTVIISGRSFVESQFGLHVTLDWPSLRDLSLCAIILASGLVVGVLPAYRAYRYSLHDGMSVRT